MPDGRRLGDVLLKFREARESLLREMGVGQIVSSPEFTRQLARLRELHEVVQIAKEAVAEAEQVHQARLTRDQRQAAEQEERRALLLGRPGGPPAPWPGEGPVAAPVSRLRLPDRGEP